MVFSMTMKCSDVVSPERILIFFIEPMASKPSCLWIGSCNLRVGLRLHGFFWNTAVLLDGRCKGRIVEVKHMTHMTIYIYI